MFCAKLESVQFRIVLRRVGTPTLLLELEILTLRKTIPEMSLCKVKIGTK